MKAVLKGLLNGVKVNLLKKYYFRLIHCLKSVVCNDLKQLLSSNCLIVDEYRIS